ncbi:serine/threonine-protein kinase [Sorangium sp. So ce131]|uniref:serine/threonine-protein kinase n=1 Tax=Sorangium sp. So ce131 TaxID=3133282 RepID=UPI003F5F3C3D
MATETIEQTGPGERTSLPTLDAGSVLDERFAIERLAGAGGMGMVYRARDLRTGEAVAVKVMRVDDRAAADRFTREAKLLAGLDHPAIVRHIGHGVDAEGWPWLAMEWLSGEDLAVRLGRQALGLADCICVALRVAQALAAAHAQGIVHRDVKPSNVFLPGEDVAEAKLLDFGIARPGRETVALTRTGTRLGTPGYMAPELVSGDRPASARADVFSLGCLLYECLSGRPAFAGAHALAVLARLLLEEPPRVDEIRADVPLALADLVARMLAKDPSLRPASGAEVVEVLARLDVERGAPSAVRPPAPALTGSEQRLFCAVVAAPEPGAEMPSLAEDLRAALGSLGARIDEAAGGALLVTLMGGAGSATDQAARAARCALVVRSFWPRGAVALVSGRGETRGRLPVGAVVERAIRMCGAGESRSPPAPAAVWIDDITRALLDVRFEVTESKEGALLLGEREIGAEARRLLGRPSPCVGREQELTSIDAVVEGCIGDEGARVILAVGAPGIGKSRLWHEASRRMRERWPDLAIWVGRGDATRASSAFALIGSALRGAAGVAGGEPLEVRREKVLSLAAPVPAVDRPRVAAFLGELAGAPFPDDELPVLRGARLDGSIMAAQVQRAFTEFLGAFCAARPLVLALEDLHWGDAPSVKLVDVALSTFADRPLAVIAFARPGVHEVHPRAWVDRPVYEMRLRGLARGAAERLVRHTLGSSVGDALVSAIVERADGNAFYLEELIRAAAAGQREGLPETVLGMVEARLSALDPDARRILRAASVFGETFWASGVAGLLGGAVPAPLLAQSLHELVAREVIVRRSRSRFAGEEEFAFSHMLLRDGAYAMLTEADGALGHRLAATWLEAAGEEDPAVLAAHRERGGEARRAAELYARAAGRAIMACDFETAIAQSTRGLACGADGDLGAALYRGRGEARFNLGDLVGAQHDALAGLERVTPGTGMQGMLLAVTIWMALMSGDPTPLASAIPALLNIEPTKDASSTLATSLAMVHGMLLYTGRPDLCAAAETKAAAAMRVSPADSIAAAWYENALGERALFMDRDPWAALCRHRRALSMFEEVGAQHHAAIARGYVALNLLGLGAHDEVLAMVAAADASNAHAHFAVGGMGLFSREHALVARGRGAEALAETAALLGSQATLEVRMLTAALHAFRAEAHLAAGNVALAERELLLAQPMLASSPVNAQHTLALQAAVLLAEGRGAEAVEPARQAYHLVETTGIIHPRHALAPLVLAEALASTGQEERARGVIAKARDDLHVRAARIPDPDLARSFLEAVPEHARMLALAARWLS